jgi:predicted permease
MDQDGAQSVCVINQSMARKFWPNEDPIGKTIKQGWPEWKTPWREVVGVVEDVKLNGIDSPTPLEVFLPLAQEPSRGLFIVVRTSLPEEALVKPIRDAVLSVDSQLPLFRARSMDAVIRESLSTRIGARLLLSVFAGIALLLAAIGLYGVISHGVGQRTQEIGIRMALGAQPRDVLRLILGEGAQLILLGLAVGVASAFALTRVLADQLYGVKPTDPASYAGGALLLAAVAMFACAIPAWRAARVNPMAALRNE